MGREIIQNSIIDSLETILSLVANVNTNKGVIPQIDIDLLKENVRKLYQEVHNLDEANQRWKDEPRKMRDERIMEREEKTPMREESEPVISRQVKSEFEKPEDKQEQKEIIEDKKDKTVSEAESKKEETVIIEENPQEIAEDPIEDEKEQEIEESKPDEQNEKEPALFDEPLSVADKFSKEEKSINEKLSEGNQNKALHQNATKSPVSNLKTAIGINDKFMFVNELFQGDMKNYDAFIREVNEMNNGAAALNAFTQKLESIGADVDAPAALKLKDYIERRFL